MGLDDVSIADGCIKDIHISLDMIEILFQSYQGRLYNFHFENVWAIKIFFLLGGDMSHINCVSSSDLTKETFKIITDENPNDFKSFQFVNVDNIVCLEIIASSVAIKESVDTIFPVKP